MHGVVAHIRPKNNGGKGEKQESQDAEPRRMETTAQQKYHGTVSSRLDLQDYPRPDIHERGHYRAVNGVWMFAWLLLPRTSCGLSRTRLATVACARPEHIMQRLLLLGTIPHDRQQTEVRVGAECHEHVERLYGEHGIRL